MLCHRTRNSDGNGQAEMGPFDEIGDERFDLFFILLGVLPTSLHNIHEGGLDCATDGDFSDPGRSFSLAVHRPRS